MEKFCPNKYWNSTLTLNSTTGALILVYLLHKLYLKKLYSKFTLLTVYFFFVRDALKPEWFDQPGYACLIPSAVKMFYSCYNGVAETLWFQRVFFFLPWFLICATDDKPAQRISELVKVLSHRNVAGLSWLALRAFVWLMSVH